jgi:hypothetical protein
MASTRLPLRRLLAPAPARLRLLLLVWLWVAVTPTTRVGVL